MDELTCSRCGTRMRYNFSEAKIMCPACGFSPLDAKMEEVHEEGPREYGKITYQGELNINARSAFNSAYDHLNDGERDKALASFKEAVFYQPDFADAHIAIADLVDDEATKREHLGIVIAYDSSNQEALRRLMVLNGRLSQEQAARTYHYKDQQVEHVDVVEADSGPSLLCPVCGGSLTIDEASGRVECKYCGYVEVRQPKRVVGADSLAMALLERKAQPVRWVVGKRIMHCNECGAERTIPAQNLVHECPFCGSKQVVHQEPMEALEQPDALIRFRVSQEQASAALRTKLDSLGQRIVNMFNNNRVAYQVMQGVYLPFWLFDALVEVTETRSYKSGQAAENMFGISAAMPVQERSTFEDGMNNVPICAVNSPPPALTRKLGPYKLDEMVAYQPKLLAKYPAQLYRIDFDEASLEARSVISKNIRSKHEARVQQSEQIQISFTCLVKNMNFQLVLMPVWVISMIEEDDDTRAALVNGQTGEVILGRSQNRKRA